MSEKTSVLKEVDVRVAYIKLLFSVQFVEL
jgi:hypothetical protein